MLDSDQAFSLSSSSLCQLSSSLRQLSLLFTLCSSVFFGTLLVSPSVAKADRAHFRLPWILRYRRYNMRRGDLWRALARQLNHYSYTVKTKGKCTPVLPGIKGSSKHGVETHCLLRGHVIEKGRWYIGKKTGLWTLRFSGGRKIAEVPFFRGLLQGTVKIWHPNGQLWAECSFRDNKKNGLCTWWYPNGIKFSRGVYKDNQKFGLWKKWYRSGKRWSVCSYVEDQFHGQCKEWYRNSKLMWARSYRDGKSHGHSVMWFRNGVKMSERWFFKGKPCGKAFFWKEDRSLYHSSSYPPCPKK